MDQYYNKINRFLDTKNIPNILFYGPFSHGKEEVCDYLLNQLYPDSNSISNYVLKINCVSVKGIKTIKEHIKLFSMQIINSKSGITFKTILLKHAEYLTYDSQYSLRRTIEQYSKNTRFILVCETKNNLLSPILSRFVSIYINNNENITNSNLYNGNTNNTKLKEFIIRYDKIIHGDDENVLSALFDLSIDIYENNFHSFEVLQRFKKHENYQNACMIFEKYRINMRDETYCIFFILTLFRNNHKIEIFDLY